jgi:hypothetical protein
MFVRTSPFDTYTPSTQHLDEDPPLLEDLGINPQHIKEKTISVLAWKRVDSRLLEDPDMAGPLLFAIIFGFLLMLAGKLHFGAIYGFGMLGSLGIYTVMNLMSQEKEIDLYRTISILGYSLLPIVVLSAVGVVLSLKSAVGAVLSICCILWSTMTASRFFEVLLEMKNQRWLIAYPVCLLYGCFTLLTVF